MSNADQYEAWNNDSGPRWASESDRRDRILDPVADALFTAAGLAAGEHVLDIGCGCGATTLAAARTVTPGGTATGIDISEPMLDVAQRRRETSGATNVRFITGDAQTHTFPRPFDVAISRLGTMFFDDPIAAFTNIAVGLRHGSRLCLATWQRFANNDWLTVPSAALVRYGTMPDIDHNAPGGFAQSDPDTVTRVLAAAGYDSIALNPVNLVLTVGTDLADGIDHVMSMRVVRGMYETVPDRDRPAALDAIRTVLADHTDDTGVHMSAAIWIITATRR
jgi:SAM-dependent methyltransferase